MNSSEETVSMQAIEFWSTICEEEIEIKETILDVRYTSLSKLRIPSLAHEEIGGDEWHAARSNNLSIC